MNHVLKKDFVFVLCNQAILSIGAVLIIVVLARFTTQEIFGQVRYLIAVLTILSFLSLPGISMVINHHASIMSRQELSSLIFTQFTWGIIALLGAFAAATFHAAAGDFELARILIIGGIMSPIANLYLVPGIILAGIRRFALKTIVDTFIICLTLLGAIIGAIYFSSALAITFWYFLMQAITTCIALFFVFNLLHIKNIRYIPALFLENMKNGRTLSYLHAPFSLIPAVEKMLIFIILGPVALAQFVIAALPVEHFRMAFRNLIQFYSLPHLPHKNVGMMIHWIGVSLVVLAVGTTSLVAFIYYGMPLLFENFHTVRHFSLLLVLSLVPLPIHIIMVFWIAERQVTNLSLYTSIVVTTNIICVAGGALLFGITGAIIGKICNELCIASGLVYLDAKHRRERV